MEIKLKNVLKLIFVIGILIYGLFLAYRNTHPTDLFTDIKLENPYFDNSIYTIPGSIGNPNVIFGASYMPYESMVPAIDVLRANKSVVYPKYYKQYLAKNITPLSSREY